MSLKYGADRAMWGARCLTVVSAQFPVQRVSSRIPTSFSQFSPEIRTQWELQSWVRQSRSSPPTQKQEMVWPSSWVSRRLGGAAWQTRGCHNVNLNCLYINHGFYLIMLCFSSDMLHLDYYARGFSILKWTVRPTFTFECVQVHPPVKTVKMFYYLLDRNVRRCWIKTWFLRIRQIG